MKNIILLLFGSLFIQISIGQNAVEFYKKGDSLYKAKDFKNAALAFSSSFKLTDPAEIILVNNARNAAACSWSLANYPDSAFYLLNKIADTKGLTFSYFLDVITDNDFTPLYKEKRWTEVKEKMFLSAKQTFSSIAKKSEGVVPNYLLIESACAWAMFNKDSACFQLQAVANSKDVNLAFYNNIRTQGLLSPLHNDRRWLPLLETIYKKAEKAFTTPQDSTYTQQEIIYGRKDGMSLTMIHLEPKFNLNHKAIIQIMSSSWRSSILNWNAESSLPYLRKGYSVFVVAHGSAPVYSIIDAVADVQRAVRFIRYKAKDFQIDPDKIGVTGSSAGGHLSLLCGLMDTPSDDNAGDPVDRVSSKVQAVACYYPPTDFLNWGTPGLNVMNSELFKATVFNHLLEFRQWNLQRRLYNYITDTTEMIKILKNISPINNVSANDAPVLIIHGDMDQTVPLQQSESLVKKLQEANVPVSLTIKKGAGHGWDRTNDEIKMFIDWFDKYLR